MVDRHPELAMRKGYWPAMNFLRDPSRRAALVTADAIRKVNNRHWIAQPDRFSAAIFELATVRESSAPEVEVKAHDWDRLVIELPLTVRTINCLKRSGIQTLGQLLAISDDDLRRIPGLGAGNHKEIREVTKTAALTIVRELIGRPQ